MGNIIAETLGGGATGATGTVREYIWLYETEIAPTMGSRTVVDRPLAVVEAVNTVAPVTYWVSVDHLNRPIKMTNAAKASVWDAVWQPFGGAHSITGSATLNARLPGQWFQSETLLHYNWHRSYDPALGRYTQPDPLGFVDGPSVYGYVKGQPLALTDPEGLGSAVCPPGQRPAPDPLFPNQSAHFVCKPNPSDPTPGCPSGDWIRDARDAVRQIVQIADGVGPRGNRARFTRHVAAHVIDERGGAGLVRDARQAALALVACRRRRVVVGEGDVFSDGSGIGLGQHPPGVVIRHVCDHGPPVGHLRRQPAQIAHRVHRAAMTSMRLYLFLRCTCFYVPISTVPILKTAPAFRIFISRSISLLEVGQPNVTSAGRKSKFVNLFSLANSTNFCEQKNSVGDRLHVKNAADSGIEFFNT
jgi:RHS repeat-associated protein